MTGLSDKDWEQISAWIDDELPRQEAEQVRAKIQHDPVWAAAADSMSKTSQTLASLRPQTAIPPVAANQNRAIRWAGAGFGLAAALAVVAVLALPTPPRSIHADYLEQTFTVPARSAVQTAGAQSVDGFPTLAEANMTLVATAPAEGAQSAHYVGRNGCRLTLIKQAGAMQTIGFEKIGFFAQDHLQAAWQVDQQGHQMRYVAVATDMDQGRFDALIAYLTQATTGQDDTSRVLAELQGAAESAAPCRIG